jgi:hypothetical protein
MYAARSSGDQRGKGNLAATTAPPPKNEKRVCCVVVVEDVLHPLDYLRRPDGPLGLAYCRGKRSAAIGSF